MPQPLDRRILLLLAALTGCAPTLDWREVRVDGGSLTALFPCRPERRVRDLVLAGAPLRMEMTSCAVAGTTFAATFADLADPAAAQRCADRFAKLPWPKILERYVRKVNPLLHAELKGMSHYWVIDQAEYATDVRFA